MMRRSIPLHRVAVRSLLGFLILAVLALEPPARPSSGASGGEENPETSFPPLREAVDPQQGRVARLGVDAWHDAVSRGQGVKFAILDPASRNSRRYLGKALPE